MQPKFTIRQAYYVPDAWTPIRCSRCIWFQGSGLCRLVSPTGSPNYQLSEISPDGVCGLFDATAVRIRLFELLYGRGAGSTGMLPQILRDDVERIRAELGTTRTQS